MHVEIVQVFGWLLWYLCICLWVQIEKKYPGSPSIVAVSMALTEGNGPYSNPLKDEGYKRFKRTDEREEQTKKRGRGGMERPHSTPHWVLIRNGRRFIKKRRRLLQKQTTKKKTGRLLFTLHHAAQWVHLFYRDHRAPERIFWRRRATNL